MDSAIGFQVFFPIEGRTDEYLATKRPSGGWWVTNETAGTRVLEDTRPDGSIRTLDDVRLFFTDRMNGQIQREFVIA